MPAAPEIEKIHKIGIIAGGGDLPLLLADSCTAQGIDVFVIGFHGQTGPGFLARYQHRVIGLAQAGVLIKALKERGISDIAMAGAIRRPTLKSLRPDLKGAEILARLGIKAMGDNTLLEALKKELEREGFCVHGAQKFLQEALMKEGVIGAVSPVEEDWIDIRHGFAVSQALGALDVGQAAIVQQGVVLGVEAAEGTDALIKRCGALQKEGKGGVLVKTCKPQQDEDLDLPTIGPDTVLRAHEAGLSGIALQAGKGFILRAGDVAKMADQYKMFVIGVSGTE